MTPERKAKIKALRQRLANLSEEERQALTARGLIATVEGRTLSLHNTLLVYIQGNGRQPSIVGGFQQWRKAGKTVKRGEHGFTIWFLAGRKDDENTEVDRFYTATVFDISQVEDMNATAPEPRPEPAREPVLAAAQPQGNDIMKGWTIV